MYVLWPDQLLSENEQHTFWQDILFKDPPASNGGPRFIQDWSKDPVARESFQDIL